MIIKCKMCGGDLAYTEGSTVCECEYCGSTQTIPNADNEKKTNLFNRANRLRMNSEFDKACAIYEQIVAEFPEEAEAYWGLCLCNYGIEYVDDPASGAKMPTCHRTLTSSIMEDSNFEQACDYADTIARKVYRDEAKAIDRIQKDILAIVANEKPYDVFICYKETAEDGGRTEDSVLAQDIYDALTGKGLKVFFSRITLEDKLGVQYEPYIYAALSSAKVMLAIGTQFEYYDAVWVKNEWSRFLGMMKTDRSKTLIPCFKDLDAYDMPKEFKGLQAQDMGKLGWMQDLVRGVEKLCGKASKTTVVGKTVVQQVQTDSPAENLMKRAYLFLEDGNFKEAEAYINKALDANAEYAPAYVAKILVDLKLKQEANLAKQTNPVDKHPCWQKALRFADNNQKKQYTSYLSAIRENTQFQNKEKIYITATKEMNSGVYFTAIPIFSTLMNFKDSQTKLQQCIAEYKKNLIALDEAKMTKELQATQAQVENITRAVRSLQEKALETQNEKDSCTMRLREISAIIAKLNQQASELKGLFNIGKKKRTELEIENLNQEQSNLKNQLNKCDNTRKECEAQLEAAQKELIRVNKRLSALKEEHSKSSDSKWTDDLVLATATRVNSMFQPNKHVTFGRYPQTTAGNDNTPIEWLVLKRIGKVALLLSRYGLDAKSYNTQRESITWEQCTIREWLNNAFLNKAFSNQEQDAILLTTVDNSKSQGSSQWNTNGGSNTQDKVFLLSYAEANKYLGVTLKDKNNTKSRVEPTTYAIKQGAYTSSSFKTADGKAAGWWWLRSPGLDQGSAASVSSDGSLYYDFVRSGSGSVRPALWVDIELAEPFINPTK